MPKVQGGGEKWSKSSKAALKLKLRLKQGKIDPNDKPKTVWESDPEFMKYNLASFRAAYNKYKAELGVHLRTANNGEQCTL